MTTRLTFLGTGGGRHTTMYQTRCTGGMLLEHGGHVLHIDPGPGALVQMNRIHYDLGRTESVIVSHCHPDHCSDAPSVIEGMTHGGWERRGHLYGSATVMEGEGGLGPCISKYHLGLVAGHRTVRGGDVVDIDGMTAEVTEARHSDPTTVGFKFHTGDGIIGYTCDTEFTEGIAQQYRGCRVLVQNVTTPSGNRIDYHLCTDTAAEICRIARPELCVFVHLGIVMIRRGPAKEAGICEERSGVRTVAGEDLMVLDLAEDIVFGRAETYGSEWYPAWSP